MARLLDAPIGIISCSWVILYDSGIYVILGLLVAGLINAFLARERISEHLGGRSFKSVLLSSLFGIPLPLCSCGVVPTAVALHRKGASKGATVSFLVSTPETGVDSIAISWALLDPLMTVARPIAAFVTAIFAGSLENLIDRAPRTENVNSESVCAVCGEHDTERTHSHSFTARTAGGIRYAFVELLGDLSKWFLLGILIAGAISYFVPKDMITARAGYGWPAMLIMAAVGIPLYMCATSSTPIASALIARGVSPGAALVFLLTGPATNAASLTLVSRFLGRRATAAYLSSIFVVSLASGWLLNWIYLGFHLDATSTVGRAAEVIPRWPRFIAAVLLLVLIVNSIVQQRREKASCTCAGNHGGH